MSARVMIDGATLAYLLDLPEGVWIDQCSRIPENGKPPRWAVTLRSSTYDLPDGDAELVYRQEPGGVPMLVGIEPISPA